MRILVLNCGSSSIKYQLINSEEETVLARGIVERIGIEGSVLEHEPAEEEEIVIEEDIEDHAAGIKMVMNILVDKEQGVLADTAEIDAVGHRVVHGGEKFASSTLITGEVIAKIEEVSDLAPLHNPHNLTGIRVCSRLMPDTPQVGVFDTAFHQTMSAKAYIYPLPYEYYKKYGIRRYGFHGTSHRYVSRRAAEIMERSLAELKIITCHLGNGASIAAIDGGKSIDTSMGLTPLEGLMMGTRCGDIDPAIIPLLQERENLSPAEIDNIMNKKSGLLGVSGVSSDSRDVRRAAKEGNGRARIASEMFNYRVKKYIGSYIAALGGVDAIIFTAGIGENAVEVRAAIMEGFSYLGIEIDPEANKIRGEEVEISTPDSPVRVFALPTDEEMMIARDTERIVNNKKG